MLYVTLFYYHWIIIYKYVIRTTWNCDEIFKKKDYFCVFYIFKKLLHEKYNYINESIKFFNKKQMGALILCFAVNDYSNVNVEQK